MLDRFRRSKNKSSEENTSPIHYIKVETPIENNSYPVSKGIPPLGQIEQRKYAEVLNHFQDDLLIPITTGSTQKEPLTVFEKFWLTRECIIRYLKASKWDTTVAIHRLEATLAWRREFGISEYPYTKISMDDVSKESETGKLSTLGYDKDGRPILYMKTNRQNTKATIKHVHQLIFYLESLNTIARQGVEKICLLIDFKSGKVENAEISKLPAIGIAKQILNILQDHYPERLGKAMFVNIPWLGWTFLKLIHPFIDPDTREKIVFDEPFTNHVDKKFLEKEYGGELDFTYNHEVYWPAFNKWVETRRNAQFQRFQEMGSCVGLSEFDLKGEGEQRYPVDYKYESN